MIIGFLFIVFVYGSEHDQCDQCLVFGNEYLEIINLKNRVAILEENEKIKYHEKYFIITTIVITTLFVVFCYLNKKIIF